MGPDRADDSANDDRTGTAGIGERLGVLRREHRDLDQTIERMHADPRHEPLALKRMKRRKLLLKDTIARLESALIPDEPA